jgi:branched-chain amino acid transport system ATP-binding protein
MLLEVRDLTVRYGGVTAVDHVSVSVAQGEVVALLGPNGAGKSSVLRTISALARPVTGEVLWHGQSVVGRRPDEVVRLGISHVPEGRRVLGQLTVRDNLELASAPLRRRGTRIDTQLGLVYDLFPILLDRQRQQAYSLSGGEQQMLVIGRALMAQPQLILLDEPTLGLAPLIVERVYKVLEDLRDRGVALLIAEQNVAGALQLASRAYVLVNGSIVLAGASGSIAVDERLRTAFVGS